MRTLSTGIGKESRVPHADYSLLIVCAEAKGPLLAYVGIKITAADGKQVLDTQSEGPWLFVALPAGSYKVEATRKDGTAHSAQVDVPAEGQKVLRLAW